MRRHDKAGGTPDTAKVPRRRKSSIADATDRITLLTLERDEALEQQRATSEVLKVISRSAFDLQTVLNTLTESAARLCDADKAFINKRNGDVFQFAVSYGFSDEFDEYHRQNPMAPGRETITGRAALEGRTVHIPDVLADAEYGGTGYQIRGQYRTGLGVPLLREGETIGVFGLVRSDVRPFTEKQIELVATFADQAAIAFENARLFDEVQAKTRDLTDSLEYQTATSDVLNVISRSPSDIQPVLDTICETACRLCDAYDTVIFLRDADALKVVAHRGPILLDFKNLPIVRGAVSGRAVLERRSIHVHDVTTNQEFPDGQTMGSRLGYRTILATPLLKENLAIGVIVVRRAEVRPFADKQITLLQIFADQAVIAIGNVQLFEEVQAKTRDLSEALTYQTGSSNILSVIASSPTDVAPVVQAIVKSACELCDAYDV